MKENAPLVRAQFGLLSLNDSIRRTFEPRHAFDSVCGALAEIGVTRIAASVLFLRPAIAAAIRRRVRKRCSLEPLLGGFTSRLRPAISGSRTAVRVLPLPARLAIYDRLIAAATRHGVDAHVCGCMNSDCGAGFCGVGGEWPRTGGSPKQLKLFN